MTHRSAQGVTQQNQPLHCSYDFMYEPIYAPSYTINFIFYDEDEYEENDYFYEEDDFCGRPLH